MHNIVVIGASGRTGSAIVRYLGALFAKGNVIAGVRDPTSEKAKALLKAGPNVQLVAADLAAPASLLTAVSGADVVFVNVPSTRNRTELAINGIQAAKSANVKHIVLLSALIAENTGILFGSQFAPIEASVKESGIPYTILRFPFFLENYWVNQRSIKEQDKVYGPVHPQAPFTYIAVSDVGEAIGKVLLDPASHANKTYRITGKTTTEIELAAAFSKSLGRKIEYVQVPYPVAMQSFLGLGMPEWQADGILELFHLVEEGSSLVNTFSNDFAILTGHEATNVDDWVAQVSENFR